MKKKNKIYINYYNKYINKIIPYFIIYKCGNLIFKKKTEISIINVKKKKLKNLILNIEKKKK